MLADQSNQKALKIITPKIAFVIFIYKVQVTAVKMNNI